MGKEGIYIAKFNEERTFGVEFEGYGLDMEAVAEVLREIKEPVINVNDWQRSANSLEWEVKKDSSLKLKSKPFELASPIMKGRKDLNRVIRVLKAIKKAGAEFANDCGFHVHIGVNKNNIENSKYTLANIVALWASVENTIRYMVDKSRRNNIYAKPINQTFKQNFLKNLTNTAKKRIRREGLSPVELKSIVQENGYGAQHDKNAALNIYSLNYRPTVEFRFAHMSFDYVYTAAWIALCQAIVERGEATNIREEKPMRPEAVIDTPVKFWSLIGWHKSPSQGIDIADDKSGRVIQTAKKYLTAMLEKEKKSIQLAEASFNLLKGLSAIGGYCKDNRQSANRLLKGIHWLGQHNDCCGNPDLYIKNGAQTILDLLEKLEDQGDYQDD